MLFDSTVMRCCLDEIANLATGATIRDVHQPRRLELALEIDREPSFLVLSAEAEWARVHLTADAPAPAERSYPLLAFARKHLRGARIVGVAQVGFDRIARLRVDARNASLLDPVHTVLIETMGKHSNIMLLNNVDTVLEAAKHVTADLSRLRTVLPHQNYEPPPTHAGADPLALDAEGLRSALEREPDSPVSRALSRSLQGMSRALVDAVLHRAGVTGDAIWSELPSAAAERVLEALRALLTTIRESRWDPVSFRDGRGPVAYAFPLPHLEPEGGFAPAPLLGQALAESVREARDRGRLQAARAAVGSAIRPVVRRIESRLEDLAAQASPEAAAVARRSAEALIAALHTVKPGSATARVPDLYGAEGDVLEVRLDPKRTPADNANRLFDRARRLEEGARRAPALAAAARADLLALEALLERAEAATNDAELLAIRREAERFGVRPGRAAEAGRKEGAPEFPSRVSSDGYEIVYARNSEESDSLLRFVAVSDDWWLHARDHRGGHVIVRTAKRPESVPKRTLMEAARLAAFLSKARHSALVPVDYTLRKYVRKARKGPAGLHLFEREKTLMVEPLRDADQPFE